VGNSRKKGSFGESIAVKYLKSKNYTILNTNFYTPYGEIDIVAKDCDFIVFIEVKLRRTKSYGDVLDQITFQKKERIIKSAHYFLAQENQSIVDCRFDFIAIFQESDTYKITHIENAFEIS